MLFYAEFGRAAHSPWHARVVGKIVASSGAKLQALQDKEGSTVFELSSDDSVGRESQVVTMG
jgi:hypothetical protein